MRLYPFPFQGEAHERRLVPPSDESADTIKVAVLILFMTLAIVAESAPLEANADGVVRLGKTRVTLDTVVTVFNQGATAEEIVYRFPSLKLADVYATIAFYLNHQQEVEAYLQQRQQQSQEIRKMNQARFDKLAK